MKKNKPIKQQILDKAKEFPNVSKEDALKAYEILVDMSLSTGQSLEVLWIAYLDDLNTWDNKMKNEKIIADLKRKKYWNLGSGRTWKRAIQANMDLSDTHSHALSLNRKTNLTYNQALEKFVSRAISRKKHQPNILTQKGK